MEEHYVPTHETKARDELVNYVKKKARTGKVISQQAQHADYTDNWQQGSGIIVTPPEISELTRIIANASRTQLRESTSTVIM